MRLPALALVVVVLAAPLSAGARPATTTATVIDRTFLCSISPRSGIRSLGVSARSGFRNPESPSTWRWLALAQIEGTDFRNLFLLAAGAPHRPDDRSPATTRWLTIDPQVCVASRASVPLSPKGLSGGEASQLRGTNYVGSDAYRCNVPSKVLVRVRAVFRTPTTLTRQRLYGDLALTTGTAVVAREAAFALRTQGGKAVAFADVRESGQGRLFAGAGCLSDD